MIEKMVTKQGCISEFWRTFQEERAKNTRITQKEVFDEMNKLYLERYGEKRYADFNSFRNVRDKKRQQSCT